MTHVTRDSICYIPVVCLRGALIVEMRGTEGKAVIEALGTLRKTVQDSDLQKATLCTLVCLQLLT